DRQRLGQVRRLAQHRAVDIDHLDKQPLIGWRGGEPAVRWWARRPLFESAAGRAAEARRAAMQPSGVGPDSAEGPRGGERPEANLVVQLYGELAGHGGVDQH